MRSRKLILATALCLTLLVTLGVAVASGGTPPKRADKNLGFMLNKPRIHNLLWDDDWTAHNAIAKGQIHTFSRRLAESGWISGATGYGVKSLSFSETADGSPICGTRAATTVTTAQVLLWATCMAGTPGTKVTIPTPRLPISNDIYVVYLPDRTTITDNLTINAFTLFGKTYGPYTIVKSSSCDDYGAYHALSAYIGGLFPIAIIPAACAKGDVDNLTYAASHEIIEAATNPLLLLGWIDNSLSNSSPDYKRFKAGEVADICSSAGAVPTAAGKRGGYSVAPYWSNSSGACVS